jgi:hypothetical protein
MDNVHKLVDFECYTPSSEPFTCKIVNDIIIMIIRRVFEFWRTYN